MRSCFSSSCTRCRMVPTRKEHKMTSTDICCVVWLPWSKAASAAPRRPGVYVFRLTNRSFGRLRGSSDVLYIGATTKSKGGLQQRLNDPRDWLSRVLSEVGPVEVGWIELKSPWEARVKEAEVLKRYLHDHVELPPFNRQQPFSKLIGLWEKLTAEERAQCIRSSG